jgi:hypothetical protein
MTRTSPDVTLSMNNGAVFRRSLTNGHFIQTRQLAPERFTNQEPCNYPIKAPSPLPPCAPSQPVEVLEVDV